MISIHAPRGGSDQLGGDRTVKLSLFQSTLPVGGATTRLYTRNNLTQISIHAPRGGSDSVFVANVLRLQISIHAPRGGSDEQQQPRQHLHCDFNPRSPWGERLQRWSERFSGNKISIHAPRGGSDSTCRGAAASKTYFNPRSPWGERLASGHTRRSLGGFQSTLPVGGATVDIYCPGNTS